ncbi:MAG TPA: histidine kinase [Methanosarcinaceae archaeon]|nr:histidine kinase [Methanosarcinaceae archaeon]
MVFIVSDIPKKSPIENTSHFKTNVLLKSIIGKDLIINDNIAVIELVKNAIDAGSTEIQIEFKNLIANSDNFTDLGPEYDLSDTSKIIITDFGIGMDVDDIETKWLNIAYSEKKNRLREDGKLFAGAKGVGRFSCDRLGEFLDIYTKKKGKVIRHLHIRWSDFEVDNEGDLQIQDVNILHHDISDEEFFKLTGKKTFEHGTIVEISKLRSEWAHLQPRKKMLDSSTLIKLRNYLEKLVNPYQNIDGESISIFLEAKEFLKQDNKLLEYERINGPVINKIFDKLDFKTTSIESFISADGAEIITVLKDKGRIIFRLREKNVKFPLLKNIKIVLFFLSQYAKIYFKKQTGVRSVNFGSIHLFINGFRVTPYGDEGNDWLGLEIRKGQGYARYFGTRDIVGWVEINDDSNDFQIISSRDGLVRNHKYMQLTNGSESYFYDIFRKLEKYVVDGLQWDRISKKNTSENEDFDELSNPEVKKFITMVENKIKKGEEIGEDEIYGETQDEKDLRIIGILYSILNTKPENILELYINEELIHLLAAENKEKVQQIFKDFKKIDTKLISGNTTKVINEVNSLFEEKEKELTEKSKKLRDELENRKKIEDELKQARIEAFRAEQKAKKEQQEREKAQKTAADESKKRKVAEKEVEKKDSKIKSLESQNLFYKNSKDQSKEQLISYLHRTGTKSLALGNFIKSALREINKEKTDLNKIIETIQKINFINGQIYTIVNIGAKGGITDKLNKDKVDIINFICEYLLNICIPYNKGIRIHVIEKVNLEFNKSFDHFNMSYLIDNFISNSMKANAKNIYFYISMDNEKLNIIIKDDGDGLPSAVLDPSSIFEPGVRYSKSSGSGLGLYDVKTILGDIGGSISVENSNAIGMCFKLVIENET